MAQIIQPVSDPTSSLFNPNGHTSTPPVIVSAPTDSPPELQPRVHASVRDSGAHDSPPAPGPSRQRSGLPSSPSPSHGQRPGRHTISAGSSNAPFKDAYRYAPLIPSQLAVVASKETQRRSRSQSRSPTRSGQASPRQQSGSASLNGNDYGGGGGGGGVTSSLDRRFPEAPRQSSLQSPRSHRRASVAERRVASERLGSMNRRMSLAVGTRPSAVIGGWESSSDEESSPEDDLRGGSGSHSGTGTGSPLANHTFAAQQLRSTHTPPQSSSATFNVNPNLGPHMPTRGTANGPSGRRRAQSLLLPVRPDTYQSSPQGSRRSSRLRPPGSILGGSPRTPPSNLPGNDASGATHPISFPAVPGAVFSTPGQVSEQSRAASMASVMEEKEPGSSPPSPLSPPLIASSIPDNSTTNNDLEHSKSRKKMKRDERQSRDPLALSLGLARAHPEAVLSVQQIQELFGDADLSSALQMMGSAAVPPGSGSRTTANPTPIPADQYHQPHSAPPPVRVDSPGGNSSTFPKESLSHPYLVSAPPALTSGDWPGRERTWSVSSSIAAPSPMRHTSTRRRAVSTATSADSDGGHVSFTHHAPPVAPGHHDIQEAHEGSDEEDGAAAANGGGSSRRGKEGADDDRDGANLRVRDASGSTRETSTIATDSVPSDHGGGGAATRAKEQSTRRRISGFFGRRKKQDEPSAPSALRPIPHTQQPLVALGSALAVERAEGSHSDIERARSPARNLAAVQKSREKDREAEMRLVEQQAREIEEFRERVYQAVLVVRTRPIALKWAQKAGTHLDGYYAAINGGLEQPPRFNPLAILRWKKRSEEQQEMRRRWEAEHGPLSASSQGPWAGHSPRSGQFGFPAALSTHNNTTAYQMLRRDNENHLPLVAPGWSYTLQDVAAFKACEGKVDYFIPPPLPSAVSADFIPAPQMESVPPGLQRGTHSVAGRSVGSSVGDKELPVSPGLGHSSTHSLEPVSSPGDPEVPYRTDSIGRSRYGIPYQTHRVHKSLSSTASPLGDGARDRTRSLRGQFEKLGNVARRNPSVSGGLDQLGESYRDKSSWPNNDTGGAMSAMGPVSMGAQGANLQHHSSLNNILPRRKTAPGANDVSTGTSDDEHHLFPRLRLKTPRAISQRLDLLSPNRRGNVDPLESTAVAPELGFEVKSRDAAAAEMRRQRQRQRSIARAQEQEENVARREDVEYDQKLVVIKDVETSLARMRLEDEQRQYAITHYIAQANQARIVFRPAADVDLDFGDLEALRRPARPLGRVRNDDESADWVPPLISESDKDYLSPSAGYAGPGRRPVRQTSGSALPLPSFGYPLQAASRRSTLDSSLGITVDPISRVDLAIDRGHEARRAMDVARKDTIRQLQQQVTTVNQLIHQKDVVRVWVRGVLDAIQRLKEDRATISLKIRGGLRPKLWRAMDTVTDLAARSAMSLVSYGIRIGRGVNWVRTVNTGWVAWALLGGVLAMLMFFYMVGAGDDANAASGRAASVAAGAADASM